MRALRSSADAAEKPESGGQAESAGSEPERGAHTPCGSSRSTCPPTERAPDEAQESAPRAPPETSAKPSWATWTPRSNASRASERASWHEPTTATNGPDGTEPVHQTAGGASEPSRSRHRAGKPGQAAVRAWPEASWDSAHRTRSGCSSSSASLGRPAARRASGSAPDAAARQRSTARQRRRCAR